MADASLGTAVLRTRLDTSGLTTGLAQAESAAERSLGQIDRRFAGIGESFTKAGTRLTLGVTVPLTALGAIGVRSAMQLETFAASLRVLIGDAERANAVFDELYEFSANVPFDWRTLTEGTRVLAAFGVEAEEVVGTLSMLGDIASGTQSDLTRLAEIYGRVLVTGRLSMQEVNSLALAGVPIYTELAKVIGVSTEEVRALISTGSIGFPELNAVLRNLTSEGGQFFGMMEAQADTVAGRLARLKDSFEQVTDVIGERLLPIFDRLIGAGQAAADWFNSLDDAAQRAIIGLGTMAAVLGPLLTTVGLLATQIPKVTAALAALRVGGLALAGPMGWAVLAVSALAGLAVALSGSSGVDSAADRARNAIASGDKGSFIGALKELKGYIDADLTSSLDALLDLLENVSMTALGTVTLMQVADSVATLSAEVTAIDAEIRRLGTAPSALDARLARDSGISIEERINTLLTRRNVILEQINDTIELSTSLAREQAGIFEGSTRRTTPVTGVPSGVQTGVAGGGTTAVSAAEEARRVTADTRRLRDAYDLELLTRREYVDSLEAHQRRLWGLLGRAETPEDRGAVLSALRVNGQEIERIERENFDRLLAAQTQYQESRVAARESLEADEARAAARRERREARSLQVIAEAWNEYYQSRLDAVAAAEAQDERRAASAARREATALRVVAEAHNEYTASLRESARLEAEAAARQAARDARREARDLLVLAEAHQQYTASLREAARLEAERQQRAAVQGAMSLNLGTTTESVLGDMHGIAAGEAVRLAEAQLYLGQVTEDVVAGALAEQIRVIQALLPFVEEGTDQYYRYVAALRAAREELKALTVASASLGKLAVPTIEVEQSLRFGGRVPGDPASATRNAGVESRADAERRIQIEVDAANRFAETVVSAGFSFGNAAIQALRDGDIAGVIKAGLSGAQGILGAVQGGPTMSLLGGAVPVLGIISGVLGLIGSLFGSGGRRELPTARAAGAAVRSAPAIDLRVIINQSLNIQSLSDPASRRAVDGLLDDMVRRVEDTLKRNVLPRLDALEGAA